MSSGQPCARVGPVSEQVGGFGSFDFTGSTGAGFVVFASGGGVPLCDKIRKYPTLSELPDSIHFTRARQRIRAALRENGIAQKIDKLVEKLLAD